MNIQLIIKNVAITSHREKHLGVMSSNVNILWNSIGFEIIFSCQEKP